MWKTVKLGDLIEIQNGYAFDSKKFSPQGKMPLIRIRDLKGGSDTQTRYTGDYDTKFIVKMGDFLIGMDGEFRCYEWKGPIALLNQRVCRLQNFKEKLYGRYLFYVINDELIKIEKNTGFTTVKHISSKKINEIRLSLPPLEQQKQIVKKLDATFAEIDIAIDIIENKIRSLQIVFDSIVKKYFVENYFNAKIEKLSKVSEYFNGLTYSPKDKDIEGTIVLRSSNIQNGKIDYSDIVRVSKTIKEKLFVRENDILICSRNGSKRLIGKSSLIGPSDERMTFGTFMMIIRSEINYYLQWFFKSSLFKDQIQQGESTAINQITRYMLDEITLPIPAEEKLIKVADKLEQLDKNIQTANSILRKKIDNYIALKSSILSQELVGKRAA